MWSILFFFWRYLDQLFLRFQAAAVEAALAAVALKVLNSIPTKCWEILHNQYQRSLARYFCCLSLKILTILKRVWDKDISTLSSISPTQGLVCDVGSIVPDLPLVCSLLKSMARHSSSKKFLLHSFFSFLFNFSLHSSIIHFHSLKFIFFFQLPLFRCTQYLNGWTYDFRMSNILMRYNLW